MDSAINPNKFDPVCLRRVQFSSDGTEYVGGYQNSNFNGYGVFFRNYQIYQSGLWEDGKLVRSLPIVVSIAGEKKAPSDPNQALTSKQATPQKIGVDKTQELKQKCLRMGLVPGSDDYKLCLASH